MSVPEYRGLTWDRPRGYDALAAAARFRSAACRTAGAAPGVAGRSSQCGEPAGPLLGEMEALYRNHHPAGAEI